jgi:hypothetical protein
MACGRVCVQALFGNLGTHKLGPQIEAHAEVLQAEAGEDTTKQVRRRRVLSSLGHPCGWCCCTASRQFATSPFRRHNQQTTPGAPVR